MSQHEQWQLSSNAAEMYERYVVPYLLGPWAPGLVELAALQPGECVLDVACGTGVVARLAAQKVGTTGQVTGLDLNPGMLAVARALPPPPGAPITWIECSAVAMQLGDATYDVVLCQQGLQFFPDRSAALREMHRVLRPGGRLVLSVWKQANPYTTAMREVVERHIGPEAAARLSATTGLGDADALHRLLVDAGFSDVHIRPSVMTIHVPPIAEFVLKHLAATPVAGAVAALSEEARTALGQDCHRALQSYIGGEGVAFPNEANLATAHT
jgi:ubiquinone/menaquinone biosynthesis C-methylase UbiE